MRKSKEENPYWYKVCPEKSSLYRNRSLVVNLGSNTNTCCYKHFCRSCTIQFNWVYIYTYATKKLNSTQMVWIVFGNLRGISWEQVEKDDVNISSGCFVWQPQTTKKQFIVIPCMHEWRTWKNTWRTNLIFLFLLFVYTSLHGLAGGN